jgi:hypothetical protein
VKNIEEILKAGLEVNTKIEELRNGFKKNQKLNLKMNLKFTQNKLLKSS